MYGLKAFEGLGNNSNLRAVTGQYRRDKREAFLTLYGFLFSWLMGAFTFQRSWNLLSRPIQSDRTKHSFIHTTQLESRSFLENVNPKWLPNALRISVEMLGGIAFNRD